MSFDENDQNKNCTYKCMKTQERLAENNKNKYDFMKDEYKNEDNIVETRELEVQDDGILDKIDDFLNNSQVKTIEVTFSTDYISIMIEKK